MSNRRHNRVERAVKVFRDHGGILRTAEALRFGIHPETLYKMRDEGTLEILSRGLFRIADQAELGNPDLVAVSIRFPQGVICLISALSFHGITTQIPHAIDLALPRGTERPRIDHPPVNIYWTVARMFACGIEEHRVDDRAVRIYSPERTLVDCFRYRNKMGLHRCQSPDFGIVM
jgi:predicted transcriptional regulator of viral defense system